MSTIKIVYDDQPNDVVDKISSALEAFGLTITPIDDGEEGDGYIEYEIEILK
jgi:hypothetical protein